MHDRISDNQLCFLGTTLEQLTAHWRTLGAKRVSFVSPTLLDGDLTAVQAMLATGGHAVETIAHVFHRGHLSPEESSWQPAREILSSLIRAAKQVGARSIYMVTGGHGTLTWEEAADAFSKAVAPCVAQARDAGVALLIENALPLYADLHIAHSLRDTVTLAEMADVGVCIDAFGCWTEAGLHDSIKRAMPRCHCIQIGDYVYGDRMLPGRAVVGDGAMPWRRILGWALEAGYRDAFDLELLGPRIDQEGHVAAAARTAERLGAILQSLGA
jgi:sugar phosphate isomerase/epimerase